MCSMSRILLHANNVNVRSQPEALMTGDFWENNPAHKPSSLVLSVVGAEGPRPPAGNLLSVRL